MRPDQLHDVFRANLRRLREEAGLTQSDLARRIGSAPGYVSDLERGRRKPNLGTLAPLAEALGIAPATLLSTVNSEVSPVPA